MEINQILTPFEKIRNIIVRNTDEQRDLIVFLKNFRLNNLILKICLDPLDISLYKQSDKIKYDIIQNLLFFLKICGIIDDHQDLNVTSKTNILYLNSIFNFESIVLSMVYNNLKLQGNILGYYDIFNFLENNVKTGKRINFQNLRSRLPEHQIRNARIILFMLSYFKILSLEFNKSDYIFYKVMDCSFIYNIAQYKKNLKLTNTTTFPLFVSDRHIDLIDIIKDLNLNEEFVKNDGKNFLLLENIQNSDNYRDIERERRRKEQDQLEDDRDTLLARKLKKKYNFLCQICKQSEQHIPTFETKQNILYCEAHHIVPLSKKKKKGKWNKFMEEELLKPMIQYDNLDIYQNLIVLCPFHHRLIHHYKKKFKFFKRKENYYFLTSDRKEEFPIYHIRGHYGEKNENSIRKN